MKCTQERIAVDELISSVVSFFRAKWFWCSYITSKPSKNQKLKQIHSRVHVYLALCTRMPKKSVGINKAVSIQPYTVYQHYSSKVYLKFIKD